MGCVYMCECECECVCVHVGVGVCGGVKARTLTHDGYGPCPWQMPRLCPTQCLNQFVCA